MNPKAQERLEELQAKGFDQSWISSDEEEEVYIACTQCQACFINKVPCHESGCPNSTTPCKECGYPVKNKKPLCDVCADDADDAYVYKRMLQNEEYNSNDDY